MLVKIGNVEREVKLKVASNDHTLCYGYVGNAYFVWNPSKYDLPEIKKIDGKKVFIKGQELIRVRKALKLFLLGYKTMLQAKKNRTPIPYESHENEISKPSEQPSKPATVSGVAKWMRENYKEWSVCYKRNDDGTYKIVNDERVIHCIRRTHFKNDEDTKAMIEYYMPHCSHCQNREHCEKPCMHPQATSNEDVFTGKTNIVPENNDYVFVNDDFHLTNEDMQEIFG